MPIHVLLASNDAALRPLIATELRYEGYHVTVKQDGASSLVAIRETQPHLAILDVSLPMLSGLEICRRLRSTQESLPVVLLDQVDAAHCTLAFESGADDYLARPISVEELIARIRAHLRRSHRYNSEILNFQDLKIDIQTREVYRGKRLIQLTPKEFDLLVYLISHPRQVLSRDRLMERVWGYDFVGESNILEVYIRYLRLKLEANQESRLIHTIRGVGYVLREAFSKRPALVQ
ncbi:MAG: response regulator transcription factor [Elainellaceae cyanobacterium]